MKSRNQKNYLFILLTGVVFLLFYGLFGVSSSRAENNNFMPVFDSSTNVLFIPCLEYNTSHYWTNFYLISLDPIQLQLISSGHNSAICQIIQNIYEYSATGKYDFNSISNELTLDIDNSDFLFTCGPRLGVRELFVESIAPTFMVLINKNEKKEIWTRDNGNSDNIFGVWKYTSENGNTFFTTLNPEGAVTITGEISYCGLKSDTGIYGKNFEFELESSLITSPGTYDVGSGAGIECIDFENNHVSQNVHAFGGSVTITSVSPNFSGTFFLNRFASEHGGPINLPGSVSGSFSVPYNSEPGGTFSAYGTINQSIININEMNVRLFK